LESYAASNGIDLDNLDIEFRGNSAVVTGDVYSDEDKKKLAAYIRQMSQQFNVQVSENLTVVDEDDEDDDDDDDDDDDYEEDEDQEYVVQRGDSFWKIAEEFYGDGTKHKIISEYNNKQNLHPGDVLQIPSLRSYIGGEKLQVMLTSIGYNIGGIDGVVGAKTTAALRQFQGDTDLKKTGNLDDDTKDALRGAFYDVEKLDGRCLQIILRDLGYKPGSIDGVVGSKTQAALREFQDDNDLRSTGKLDADTIGALVEAYA